MINSYSFFLLTDINAGLAVTDNSPVTTLKSTQVKLSLLDLMQ